MAEKVASLYAEVTAKTDGLKRGLTSAKGDLTQFGKGMNDAVKSVTGLDIASLSVAGAVAGIGLALKKSITDTIAYGKEVDDLSRSLGISTEEASKVIQIADDLRIEIGALQMGFKTAIREGVNPNIEGLKRMAVEYQALPTPVEKAQYSLKMFGRAGLELNKILELTPGQLDDMAKSAEQAGLVLDQTAVQATKDMWTEVDNLKDKMEGMKVKIGIEIIPYLTKAFNAAELILTWKTQINNALNEQNKNLQTTTKSYAEYTEGMLAAAMAAGKMSEEDAKLILAWAQSGQSLDELATSQDMYQAGLVGLIYNLGLMTEAEYDLARQDAVTAARMQGLATATTEAGGAAETSWGKFYALSEAIKRGGVKAEEAVNPLKGFLAVLDSNVASPLEAFIADLKWWMAGGGAINVAFQNLKTGLETGAITPEDAAKWAGELYTATEDVQVDLDNITADEAAANISKTLGVSLTEAKGYIDSSDGIYQALQKVTSTEWWINIYFKTHGDPVAGIDTGGTGADERGRYGGPQGATGLNMIVPPGFPNDTYNVRVSSGERVSVSPSGQGGEGDVYVVQNFYNAGAAALGMAYVDTLRGKRLDASMGR